MPTAATVQKSISTRLTLSGHTDFLHRSRDGQEGTDVRSVRVRMRAADLSREMIAMRRWLDRTRYALTRFDCDQNGNHVIVSVDLTSDAAAAAFAEHLDGESCPSASRR